MVNSVKMVKVCCLFDAKGCIGSMKKKYKKLLKNQIWKCKCKFIRDVKSIKTL